MKSIAPLLLQPSAPVFICNSELENKCWFCYLVQFNALRSHKKRKRLKAYNLIQNRGYAVIPFLDGFYF